jgi:hypothetical protein
MTNEVMRDWLKLSGMGGQAYCSRNKDCVGSSKDHSMLDARSVIQNNLLLFTIFIIHHLLRSSAHISLLWYCGLVTKWKTYIHEFLHCRKKWPDTLLG